MNISPITQQQTYIDKNLNKMENTTTEFKDELNKHEGGKIIT